MIRATPLLLGMVLWHLKGMRKTSSFLVSNLMTSEWGIEPDAKRRALSKLEKAGLVSIERRGKRSPRVTMLAVRIEGGTVKGNPTRACCRGDPCTLFSSYLWRNWKAAGELLGLGGTPPYRPSIKRMYGPPMGLANQ